MISTSNIQKSLNFVLVQIANEARYDGTISRNEQKILNGLRDLIKDFGNITSVMAEEVEISPEEIGPQNFTQILDKSFQFILEHLFQHVKKDGIVSKDETALLEVIAERLEQVLDSFLSPVKT